MHGADRAVHKKHPGIAISVGTGSFEEITSAVITRRVDMGVGFIWREGTGRTDGIRPIPVRDMDRHYDEVVFMPHGVSGLATQTFVAAAKAFRAFSQVSHALVDPVRPAASMHDTQPLLTG